MRGPRTAAEEEEEEDEEGCARSEKMFIGKRVDGVAAR